MWFSVGRKAHFKAHLGPKFFCSSFPCLQSGNNIFHWVVMRINFKDYKLNRSCTADSMQSLRRPSHPGFWLTLLSFLPSGLLDKACPSLIYEVLSQRSVALPSPCLSPLAPNAQAQQRSPGLYPKRAPEVEDSHRSWPLSALCQQEHGGQACTVDLQTSAGQCPSAGWAL